MVSSCGKTVMHKDAYVSRFEDEFGNVMEKELPRPTIAHMLYEFLPLIDKHNKTRQNALALEKCWLTKNCWVRILTTFLGMAVVDLQRWDRRKRYGHAKVVDEVGFDEDGDEIIDDFDIKCMANLIGKPLSDGQCNYYRDRRQPTSKHAYRPVERICGPDGSIVHPVKNVGDKVRVRQQSCFICRQYKCKPQNTQWKCKDCGMPLCNVDRSDGGERKLCCINEHTQSKDQILGCNLVARNAFILPNDYIQFNITRGQRNQSEECKEAMRKRRKQSSMGSDRNS